MKWKCGIIGLSLGLTLLPVQSAETNPPALPASVRLGVYDSRIVAYAWFLSDAHMAQLKEQTAAARAAKQAGDETTFKADSAALRAEQDQIHRELFSTAPPTEALVAIKARLPEIEQAAGVSNLVSQWDEPTINHFPHAEKVDLTDDLVRAFITPTEKQLKMIASLKKSKPLPLAQCNELIRQGKI
jgi:hypothetical protein